MRDRSRGAGPGGCPPARVRAILSGGTAEAVRVVRPGGLLRAVMAATVAAACGLVALAHGAAGATPARLIASNGAVIEMPDIAGLDCPGMQRVLRLIDLAGYRGPAPLRPEDPDWPIFDYEDRLSRAHYFDCLVGKHGLDDPGPAFSFGFEPQQ